MVLRSIPLLIILTMCSCSSGDRFDTADWHIHESNGITLKMPEGWMLTAKDDGIIIGTGPAAEEILLWPVFIAGKLSAHASRELLQSLVLKVYPDARWGAVESVSNDMFKITGTRRGSYISALILLREQNNRTGGMLYVVSAPEDTYPMVEETFSGIVNTVQVRGPVASDEFTDRQPIQYRFFEDPREGAFKVQTPQGWNVTGGTDRYAAVDVRPWLRMTDPSGDVTVFYGDTNIPPFTVPTQMLSWTGFVEGTWYSPGYGVNMYVSRYLPGEQFARQYISQGNIPGCRVARATDSRNRSDIIEDAQRLTAGYGLAGIRYDAGEVRINCGEGENERNGYVLAVTMLTQTPGMDGGVWGVWSLSGYVAAPEKEFTAEEVYGNMVNTFEINPAWHRQQQQLAVNVSGIVAETGAEISEIISRGYERRSRSQDEIIRRYSNYLRGVEDVRDPEYGNEYRVYSGSNYYWMDNSGTVLGTDLHINPDINSFREMIRLD